MSLSRWKKREKDRCEEANFDACMDACSAVRLRVCPAAGGPTKSV